MNGWRYWLLLGMMAASICILIVLLIIDLTPQPVVQTNHLYQEFGTKKQDVKPIPAKQEDGL